MNPIWLPDGLRPLKIQVAGHTFQEDTDTIGMLQDTSDNSYVLKPLGKPACAERELAFYHNLQNAKDSLLRELQQFVPNFYEHVKLHINQREMHFLKLENTTHGMENPCIMDIKIGRRTWDPEASPKKRCVEEKKYIKCKQTLGLCIPGFQLYEADSGLLLRHSKEYGKQLDVNGFKETMKVFFNVQAGQQYSVLVKEVLRQLYDIRLWFNKQRIFNFYASSILIAYDFAALQSKHNKTNSWLNGNLQMPWVTVRMIDFAHVFPAENGALDENYLFGLENLIKILEQLPSVT